MTRYALYFAPRPESLWWRAGCQWLGRDPVGGMDCAQPTVPDMLHLLLAKLTSDARRYGFHATIKAPFRLQSGFTEAHLLAMTQAFCTLQRPIAVGSLEVKMLGTSLALRSSAAAEDIDTLVMRCVSYFDLLRAAPKEDEQKKYRDKGLNDRQEQLLQRWGYPYVEEEFRFHLTLTDSLVDTPNDIVNAMQTAAQTHFAKALASEPLCIDALTIFREDEPGSPFVAWQRIPFNDNTRVSAVPTPGRLFYFVDAAATGRESLLNWVREQMSPGNEVVFAQRTITRPALASELHEPVDDATFWQLAQDGHFSMLWQANGLCYGIRRSIEVELQMGRNVIVNGAREYLPQLRCTFPQATVIWLEADDATVLHGDDLAVTARAKCIGRVGQFSMPVDTDFVQLDDSDPIQLAGRRLLDILSTRE